MSATLDRRVPAKYGANSLSRVHDEVVVQCFVSVAQSVRRIAHHSDQMTSTAGSHSIVESALLHVQDSIIATV